jgi:DNA (cytosine-5)-methyltransferase 1
MDYYNEFDPYTAQWLENAIHAKVLPPGRVDRRSIIDVKPRDLAGFTQCHIFAGIGGWKFALKLAGWPDTREAWTGSCPCQPFSTAGQKKGFADERHLWPAWFALIRACWPAVVLGEQVTNAIGKHWLDGVFDDMEGESYAGRAFVIPACSVDSPQPRERIWFVFDGYGIVEDRRSIGSAAGLATAHAGQEESADLAHHRRCADCGDDFVGDAAGEPERFCIFCRGFEGSGAIASAGALDAQHGGRGVGGRDTFWSGAKWIIGPDGKARRIKPGVRLLAPGFSSRVGRLRAYGNSIVPQVAAEVIKSYMDCAP